jgi:transposase
LVPRQPGQPHGPGKKGGEVTGPNPTDRGKAGSKQQVLVERRGIPLSVGLSAANGADCRPLAAMLDAVQPITRPLGRPRKRPDRLHADKAYDAAHCRAACRQRGITPRIARRGRDSSERLGPYRWVVERTLGWLARYRRLRVRDERLADVHLAFLQLGCALICLNFWVDRF